jgi:hypothetical protein
VTTGERRGAFWRAPSFQPAQPYGGRPSLSDYRAEARQNPAATQPNAARNGEAAARQEHVALSIWS